MKTCDACGKSNPTNGIGGAMLCRTCSADVHAEIDSLRAEGKQVNALGIARRIFKEQYSAGSYLLRDIPQDLWDAAKHKAIDEGMSLRDMLLDALRARISQ